MISMLKKEAVKQRDNLLAKIKSGDLNHPMCKRKLKLKANSLILEEEIISKGHHKAKDLSLLILIRLLIMKVKTPLALEIQV